MTLAEVVAEVYGVPAAGFVAARTVAARAAADDGDRALAKRIAALTKPSAAAAAVNALGRAEPDRLAELSRLHDRFSDAQDEGDRDALQAVNAQRRALIDELTDRARGLVAATGGRLSAAAAAEVGATLLAAVADDTAAHAVASGYLTRALTANGFDPADIDDALALPLTGLRAVPGSVPGSRPGFGSLERAGGASTKQREERAALKDAMRAATRANADLERSNAAHRRAAHRAEKLHSERDELADQLVGLDRSIDAVTRELDERAAARSAAKTAAREAEAAVASARRTAPKRQ